MLMLVTHLLVLADTTLTAGERSSSFTLTNDARSEAHITLTVQSWTHDENGAVQLQGAHGVSLSVEDVTLASGGRQDVKVTADAELEDSERAYFVVITRPDSQERLAVFTQKHRGHPQVWVGDAGVDLGEGHVMLTNQGSAHDFVAEVTVALLDSSGATLTTVKQPVGWMLSGSNRKVSMHGLPACAGGKINVTAQVGSEMLRASFPCQ